MQEININELKPHPRNTDFFDDMSGKKWDELKESIKVRFERKNNGEKDIEPLISPILVTTDMTIVSGHQRVRACMELGIKTVQCEIRKYSSENDVLKDLIESNIRQRNDISGSVVKIGRMIKELERLYEISNGGNRGNQYILPEPNNSDVPKTQEDIAKEMGISVDTLNNYKRLTEMIPELEDLVDTGIVTKTTALAMMKNLSLSEQKELLSTLPTDKKYTQTQMDTEIQKYKNKISELVQQGTKTEIVINQVDKPETLAEVSNLRKQLEEKNKKNLELSSSIIEKEKMLSQTMGISTNYQLTSHCSEITLKMLNFVKEMAQYDYMAESFNEIPTATRIEYEKCIKSVKKWADRILETINIESNIIDM